MGIGHVVHTAFIEKCVEHRTQKHLKGGRGADAGSADHVAGHISVKSANPAAGFLKAF